jgi:hypothetical protein
MTLPNLGCPMLLFYRDQQVNEIVSDGNCSVSSLFNVRLWTKYLNFWSASFFNKKYFLSSMAVKIL